MSAIFRMPDLTNRPRPPIFRRSADKAEGYSTTDCDPGRQIGVPPSAGIGGQHIADEPQPIFPEFLHFLLGDWTEEYGPPQPGNMDCCLATEGCRASSDLTHILAGRKINGKAIWFTGSGLGITIAGWTCFYKLPSDKLILILQFEDRHLHFDGTNKIPVVARRAGAPRPVEKNSVERKTQINQAARLRRLAVKNGTHVVTPRDRLAVLRRQLKASGDLV